MGSLSLLGVGGPHLSVHQRHRNCGWLVSSSSSLSASSSSLCFTLSEKRGKGREFRGVCVAMADDVNKPTVLVTGAAGRTVINEAGQVPEVGDQVNSIGVKAALSILKFYKKEISPLLPKSCRYVPTCSEYSMTAYKKYGFVKGTVLTTWRICRCNPLGGSGFDPPRWFDEEPVAEE